MRTSFGKAAPPVGQYEDGFKIGVSIFSKVGASEISGAVHIGTGGGRKAWLFAGSELVGQCAANVMSLVQSTKMQGHDPWAYLKDVLTRLPSHLNSRIDELLPHRWQPQV